MDASRLARWYWSHLDGHWSCLEALAQWDGMGPDHDHEQLVVYTNQLVRALRPLIEADDINTHEQD